MKRLILLILLIGSGAVSLSQNRIVLTSGKTIKEARLFKEYPTYITYERRYSLHDLEKFKIDYIETDSAIIKYQPDGTAYVRYKYARPAVKTVQPQNKQPKVEPNPETKTFQPRSQNSEPKTIERVKAGDYRSAHVKVDPMKKDFVNASVSWLAAGGVGLTAGAAGTLAGVLTGLAVDQPGVGAGIGLGVGTAIGAAVGAQIVGELRYGQGGLEHAMFGSFIGTGLGAGLIAIAANQEYFALIIPAVVLPATGAVIGYRAGMSHNLDRMNADLSLYPTSSGMGMTLTF